MRPDVECTPASAGKVSSRWWEASLNDLTAPEVYELGRWDQVSVTRDDNGNIVGTFPGQSDHGRYDCRIHAFLYCARKVAPALRTYRYRLTTRGTAWRPSKPAFLDVDLHTCLAVEPRGQPVVQLRLGPGVIGREYVSPLECEGLKASGCRAFLCKPSGKASPVTLVARFDIFERQG